MSEQIVRSKGRCLYERRLLDELAKANLARLANRSEAVVIGQTEEEKRIMKRLVAYDNGHRAGAASMILPLVILVLIAFGAGFLL